MSQESSNALLQPMEDEDFQNTALYSLLATQKKLWSVISGFLSASSVKELAYAANPLFLYAPYGQEDFDEIGDYLRYNGELSQENRVFKEIGSQYADSFSLVHTAVGDYVIYYDTKKNIQGILSRK